ncbi:hypothetical protein [Pseudonocardia endophytica]|uniref:4-amino-4-deoxy-L-arabinose transferase-like glycosyltransferase n=1 Tax=Pseudonocardia endophytica TaxID=401976 RepID=A0A4R1HWC3_PSEEN|nr:hypothetical protein [Pseudonocardia endophytica]TCK25335.1 hypothetical protein EV378_1139 [Pseudonocardia endophytica]
MTLLEETPPDAPAVEHRPRGPRFRVRRPDPLLLAVIALAALTSVATIAVNAGYNDGRFAPPLDDVYIHLQYASRIGHGEFLRYMPGDSPTTGASSLLYVLLLGAVAAVGVGGSLLLYAAVAFGVVCFVATVAGVYLLGRALASRTVGTAAAALTALSGALLWGATSGMEVGLVSALVVATLLAFVVEQPRARFVATPVAGTLLAITRPEGLVVVVAVLLGVAVVLGSWWRARRAPHRRLLATAALCLLPLVAAGTQSLVYDAMTGTAENNGIAAKSWLSMPLTYPLEVADKVTGTVQDLLGVFGGTTSTGVVGPATLVLAAVGLAALVLGRPPRRVLAGVLAVALGGVLVAVSTLMTANLHNGRYLQPLIPVVLLLTVLGIRAVAAAVPDPRRARVLGAGLLGVALLLTAVEAPTWALRSGQQGAAIRESAVSVAAWLRGHTPPDSRIAVNDVGAVAYLSGRRTVDLIGLTTNGFAEAANEGPGALYETLARMPADRRPTHFSIFRTWGGANVAALGDGKVFSDEPLIAFLVKSPQRGGLPFPAICQTGGECPEIDVWAADWSHLGSGDLPDAPVPGRIVDRVNVGDPVDEAAHGYSVQPALVGLQPMTTLRHETGQGGRVVVDSGRHVVGGETFTLRGLTPGRPVTLTGRVDALEPAGPNSQAGVVAVTAGGQRLGEWEFATSRTTHWATSSFTVPADAVTGPELTVTLGPRTPYLAPYPDYTPYSYWASQE